MTNTTKVRDILNGFQTRHIRVAAADGVVKCDAPEGELTDADREVIRANKTAILAHLHIVEREHIGNLDDWITRTTPTHIVFEVPLAPDHDELRPAPKLTGRRLLSCGFKRRPTPTPPPPEILADPVVTCPQCQSARVLRELRTLTHGLCLMEELNDSKTTR